MVVFTMEVIPEFSGVGQGLDDAVHEAGVAQVNQSCESRQAHLLLLLFLVALVSSRWCMGHGLHHASRLGLRLETQAHISPLIFTHILVYVACLTWSNLLCFPLTMVTVGSALVMLTCSGTGRGATVSRLVSSTPLGDALGALVGSSPTLGGSSLAGRLC